MLRDKTYNGLFALVLALVVVFAFPGNVGKSGGIMLNFDEKLTLYFSWALVSFTSISFVILFMMELVVSFSNVGFADEKIKLIDLSSYVFMILGYFCVLALSFWYLSKIT